MSFETNLNELSNQHLAFVILHLFLSRQLVRHYVAPYTCFVVKKHFPISNDHSAQHDVILKRQFGMQKRERESLRLDASSTRYLISDCVMMTNTDRFSPDFSRCATLFIVIVNVFTGSDMRVTDFRFAIARSSTIIRVVEVVKIKVLCKFFFFRI